MSLPKRLLLLAVSVPPADFSKLSEAFKLVRMDDPVLSEPDVKIPPVDAVAVEHADLLESIDARLLSDQTVIFATNGVSQRAQSVHRLELTPALLQLASSLAWKSTLVGESVAMARIRDTIELVARRRCTVLISGETGTGKEVAARAIHMASDRAHMPFVAVNCAALPDALLEAELFGHTRGAFTGAVGPRTGLFERAHEGTLFLDEIGEMPLDLQAKLLRVLQEREILRLGSSTPTKVDVRVLAASNVDLAEAVRQRRFRGDLYYRLNVVPLHLPPLRERRTDIRPLAQHLIAKICSREGLSTKQFTPDALERLESWDWHGNVRELEHCIEMSAMMSGDRAFLTANDFPGINPLAVSAQLAVEIPEHGLDFEAVIIQIQKALLNQALQKSGGNKARAAVLLGMKRTTLTTKVKTLSHSAR